MDATEIILTELRQLRSSFQEHSSDVVQRLTKLEAQMSTLVGNGRPGLIQEHDDRLEALEAVKGKAIGAGAALSLVFSALCSLAVWLMDHSAYLHLFLPH